MPVPTSNHDPSSSSDLLGDWDDMPSHSSYASGTTEFFAEVELWQSAKSSVLRKSKKKDKRDSQSQNLILSGAGGEREDDRSPAKKIKESRSWLAIPHIGSQAPSAGQWKTVVAKVIQLAGTTVLHVITEEHILQHSVYLHQLNNTDIRPVHRSLFGRADVLGVHPHRGQSMTHTDPIYLSFPSQSYLHAWLTLLRSYTKPETYGKRLAPPHIGGLYRMWRQVEVQLESGKNVGVASFAGKGSNGDLGGRAGGSTQQGMMPDGGGGGASGSGMGGIGMMGDTQPQYEESTKDQEIYIELTIDKALSGRSTPKRAHNPQWHERFLFTDLPPLELLTLSVLRDKRMAKGVKVGSVLIYLNNFTRGEWVDAVWPVIGSSAGVGNSICGEVKLKIKVDEEIILPAESYNTLLDLFRRRNYIDLLTELQERLNTEHIFPHLFSIAMARGTLLDDILWMAEKEVDNADPRTLFRGNSNIAKAIEKALMYYGRQWLELSLGSIIRRLIDEKVTLDIDPGRFASTGRSGAGAGGGGFNTRELEMNVRALAQWCETFWESIYSKRADCPKELRTILQAIRQLVENKWREVEREDLKWQAVSSFVFLRFFVPAILNPHLFQITAGIPAEGPHHSLKLVAKQLMSLANLNSIVQKEEFMREIKEFLRRNNEAMIDYLYLVSNDTSTFSSSQRNKPEEYNRIPIIQAIRERQATMPALQRESIPSLPHVIDVSKHVAVVASALVRGARGPWDDRMGVTFPLPPPPPGQEASVDYFAMLCFSIDTQGLKVVERLKRANDNQEYRSRGSSISTMEFAPGSSEQEASGGASGSPGMTFSRGPLDSESSASGGPARRKQKMSKPAASTTDGEDSDDSIPLAPSRATAKTVPAYFKTTTVVQTTTTPRPTAGLRSASHSRPASRPSTATSSAAKSTATVMHIAPSPAPTATPPKPKTKTPVRKPLPRRPVPARRAEPDSDDDDGDDNAPGPSRLNLKAAGAPEMARPTPAPTTQIVPAQVAVVVPPEQIKKRKGILAFLLSPFR